MIRHGYGQGQWYVGHYTGLGFGGGRLNCSGHFLYGTRSGFGNGVGFGMAPLWYERLVWIDYGV